MIGAAIGSFLNVVIYRMPRKLSIAKPSNSFCPTCNHPLGPTDLIPLLSWLTSKGRCRHCGEKVSSRYFWVEIATGTLWAAIWYQYFCASSNWVAGIFFAIAAATSVAITFIDWELYIIPDELNAFLLLVGLAMGFAMHDIKSALLGAFIGWALLWGMAFLARLLFGKDGMGHGDIKMMRGMGAILGPVLVIASLGIAVVVGLVIGVTLIVVSTRLRQRPDEASGADDEGDASLEPESIPSLIKLGAFYLICGDIFAIFFPVIYTWIGESSEEVLPEDDDWKPGLTTIPFGPYLAIGCIICMIFSQPIQTGIQNYWKASTGSVTLLENPPTVYRIAGQRV